jgi:cobalamin biosynthetic protein CobC
MSSLPTSSTSAPYRTAVFHGGDLSWARGVFGGTPGEWQDLSTGINPTPYPVGELPGEAWTRLPDTDLERRLGEAAAAYYGTPDADCLVPAPGSQSLIQILPYLRPRGTVAVIGPTYGEHAHCWAFAGHSVRTVAALGDVPPDADAAAVTNPDNPTGRRYDPEALAALAARLAARGGFLVVDEAFADVAPELSLAPRGGAEGLVVLRSFGKFFGLAGGRLGFAAAPPEVAGMLRARLGPWAVSGPAAWVALRALADRDWIEKTRDALARRMSKQEELLRGAGLEIIGATSLFCLVGTEDAAALFEYLAGRRILVRSFPEHPGWLRFGIAPDATGLDRLERALKDWNGR